jgi:hypothetical protein
VAENGPWNDYQPAPAAGETGPWTDYQQQPTTKAPTFGETMAQPFGLVGEPIAQMATGLASTAAGVVGGVVRGRNRMLEAREAGAPIGRSFDLGWEEMKGTIAETQRQGTYQPRTEAGKKMSEVIGYVPGKITELAEKGAPYVGAGAAAATEALGGGQEAVERARRVGTDVGTAAAQLAPGAIDPALAGAGRALRYARPLRAPTTAGLGTLAETNAAQAARAAQISIPTEGAATTLAGRDTLFKQARGQNQIRENQLGREAVGLGGEGPITKEDLATLKTMPYGTTWAAIVKRATDKNGNFSGHLLREAQDNGARIPPGNLTTLANTARHFPEVLEDPANPRGIEQPPAGWVQQATEFAKRNPAAAALGGMGAAEIAAEVIRHLPSPLRKAMAAYGGAKALRTALRRVALDPARQARAAARARPPRRPLSPGQRKLLRHAAGATAAGASLSNMEEPDYGKPAPVVDGQ